MSAGVQRVGVAGLAVGGRENNDPLAMPAGERHQPGGQVGLVVGMCPHTEHRAERGNREAAAHRILLAVDRSMPGSPHGLPPPFPAGPLGNVM
jgi:hypothetical protein